MEIKRKKKKPLSPVRPSRLGRFKQNTTRTARNHPYESDASNVWRRKRSLTFKKIKLQHVIIKIITYLKLYYKVN